MRILHDTLALFGLAFLVGCAATTREIPAPSGASAEPFQTRVSFVSEGDTLRGTMFTAAGAGPHPTVLFLSGFPGWPDPPGFLRSVHDAGYNVLFFPYRGTWGSDGEFSADHALADAKAALSFLRTPEARAAYRVDAGAIAAWGVSLGGWTALSLAADDFGVACVAATVIGNIGAFGQQWSAVEPYRLAWRQNLERMTVELPVRLHGGPEGVMSAIMTRADEYDLPRRATILTDRPIILFGAESDEVAPLAFHYHPVADAFRRSGVEKLTLRVAPGGHADARAAWDAELVRWLQEDCFGER
jgi:uncharacterized protein